jgi:hypothetical protein
MAIPRVIHYCWFGKKAKGSLINNCIESWSHFLPGYQIMEWNDGNYHSDSFFFRHCMTLKKYAFASDYARFDILYNQGGIYLDTDMLLIRPLGEVMDNHCFFGYETAENISCGIIGAIPHEPFIARVKDKLDKVSGPSFFSDYTIVRLVNTVYKELSEEKAILPTIYPIDYFYPFPFEGKNDPMGYRTENTLAIHLWNASWFNDMARAQLYFSQGKKKEARLLYFKSLLYHPQYLRFFHRFF